MLARRSQELCTCWAASLAIALTYRLGISGTASLNLKISVSSEELANLDPGAHKIGNEISHCDEQACNRNSSWNASEVHSQNSTVGASLEDRSLNASKVYSQNATVGASLEESGSSAANEAQRIRQVSAMFHTLFLQFHHATAKEAMVLVGKCCLIACVGCMLCICLYACVKTFRSSRSSEIVTPPISNNGVSPFSTSSDGKLTLVAQIEEVISLYDCAKTLWRSQSSESATTSIPSNRSGDIFTPSTSNNRVSLSSKPSERKLSLLAQIEEEKSENQKLKELLEAIEGKCQA